MSDSRLHLLALCVAHEAFCAAADGPVERSYGLRLALGFLCRDCPREPFLSFLEAVCDVGQHDSENMRNIARSQSATGQWNAMVRALGYRADGRLERELMMQRGLLQRDTAREAFVEIMRAASRERENRIFRKRTGRDLPVRGEG